MRLELESVWGLRGGSRTFDVYQVLATADELATDYPQGSVIGMAIFDDLGTGEVYGTKTATRIDVGSVLEVELSATAVADINAAIRAASPFSVGVRVRGPFDPTFAQGLRFSRWDEPRVHQLAIAQVPEPSSLTIFGLGTLGLCVLRRRSRVWNRSTGDNTDQASRC